MFQCSCNQSRQQMTIKHMKKSFHQETQIKQGDEYATLEWQKFKLLVTSYVDEDEEQIELSLECKIMQPFWKTVWQFLANYKYSAHMTSAIAVPGIYPNELKTCPHLNLQINVSISFIPNCQNLEATTTSFKSQMGRKIVALLYTGILLTDKKQ